MTTQSPRTYQTDDPLDLVTNDDRFPILKCDWRTGDIDAGTWPESMRQTYTPDEWHGHVSQYRLRHNTDATALSTLIQAELRSLVDRVAAGYWDEWDGSNRVARFDMDAQAAREEISACVEGCNESRGLLLPDGCGYMTAGDWLEPNAYLLPLTAESTDAELWDLAGMQVCEAAEECILLDRDEVFDRLRWERSQRPEE